MSSIDSPDSSGSARLTRQQRRARDRTRQKEAARKGLAFTSGAALSLGVGLGFAHPAAAATFTVTNLNDSGAGSLRQAIADANGAAGADVVDFQAGLTGTITLTTGQLSITDSVDVQGPGAAMLTVSGNNASRVFYLYNSASLLDVTLSGLTVTDGNASAGGGIIDYDENLTLDDVVITGNHATSDGGGLWADGFSFSLTIQNSELSGNTADNNGGAIYVEDTGGPLLIQNTEITGNDAGSSGGGVYFYDPDDAVTFDQVTIAGNTAGGGGGGIFLYDTDGGPFTIQGSTISGNQAAAGGGLFLYGPDDSVVIESSTISGNTATGDGGGIYAYDLYGASLDIRHSTIAGNDAGGAGGGVYVGSGTVTLDHTIVGDNPSGANDDVCGTGDYDASFSLIESPGTATINDNGGNVFNQDPQLGPLADSGGPTETHLPAFTSPAVNAGDPAFTPPPATDQRGQPRVVAGRIDIGAVELAAGTLQFSLSAYSVGEAGGTVTITVTRVGGTDGTVSVSFQSSDGTANQPADYAPAAGTLNWADDDAAPKTFTVTIVNDNQVEGDETVNLALNNPQGAALGSPATAVLTIVDDDNLNLTAEVPTLGEMGKLLFVGLCGLAGLLALRRRKLAAPAILLSLALAGATGAEAGTGDHGKPEIKSTVLTQVETAGSQVVLHLADGTTITADADDVHVRDRRHGHAGPPAGLGGLTVGQSVLLEIKHAKDGSIKKVKVELRDPPGPKRAGG